MLCLIFVCIVALNANAQHICLPRDSVIINNFSYKKQNQSTAIKPDFYSSHMSLFCKEELKLEKQFHTPVIFRLGSVEYNNWLEQKPGYIYKP